MKKFIIYMLILICACIWGQNMSLEEILAESEKTEIVFMANGTGDYAQQYKESLEEKLLEEFPDIEIVVEAYPEEQYYDILNTKLSMGEGPDIFFIQPNWAGPNAVRKLAPAGYLEPIEDLPCVQKATDDQREPVSYEGHVYSLSYGNMILCTYYNKKIFEKYHISVPQNWKEFLEVCEKLKQNGITPIIAGNKDSFALQFGLYQIAANVVYAKNPDFNEELEDGTTAFTDLDTWNLVIDQYMELYDNEYVQEHTLVMSNAEAVERFAKGEAAMLFGGNFNYSSLKRWLGKERLGAFPLPGNKEGDAVYTVVSYGGGSAVYAGGKNVELSKKILNKLLTYEKDYLNTEESIWNEFVELQEAGQYTINCNQGWKGDVEWVLEDGISRKIGGGSISTEYITEEMQKAYDQG